MMGVTHSNTCAGDGGVKILSCLLCCDLSCETGQGEVQLFHTEEQWYGWGCERGDGNLSSHMTAPLLLIKTPPCVWEWKRQTIPRRHNVICVRVRRCPWLSDCYFILHVCTSARSWKDWVTRSYSVKNSCSASRHTEILLFLVTVLNNERRTESCDCVPRFRSLPSRSEWANYSPSQMTINHVSLLVLLGNR